MVDSKKNFSELGTVSIEVGRIDCVGFSLPDGTCRETAILAVRWAIAELEKQHKLMISDSNSAHVYVG